MVKKSMKKKEVKKEEAENKNNKDFWFKSRKNQNWGWIPLSWKGWIAFILLMLVNIFSAQYFDLLNITLKDFTKFLIVFLLSLFVFISISLRKTRKK